MRRRLLNFVGPGVHWLAIGPDRLIGPKTGVEESNPRSRERGEPFHQRGSSDVRSWGQEGSNCWCHIVSTNLRWCREKTRRTSGVNYRVNWFKLDHHIFSGTQSAVISVIVTPDYSSTSYRGKASGKATRWCTSFLPDPGVSGVRSMGPGVPPSKNFVKLCWCDSGSWWYQLNTDWWCQ